MLDVAAFPVRNSRGKIPFCHNNINGLKMKIGHIDLGTTPVLLAPMEDVSDPPFRLICKRYGADLVYTEFISSSGLIHEGAGSVRKLDIRDEERPVGIQIFGGEVEQVREAAGIVARVEPDLIDINFGCPVRKVVRKDAGAGILRDLPKMKRITEAVIREVSCPVTVKTRLGWDDRTIRILDVARMLEDAGVKALTVHARTRKQMYQGEARWGWLTRIREECGLRIPLFGNGDALDARRIKEMFETTGVDGVMVGRGAIGNPWIFRDAHTYLETGVLPEPPSWEERVAVVCEHLRLKCEWLGERVGVLEMRRMYGGYFKGFRFASKLRQRLMEETTLQGAVAVIENFQPEG